MDSLLVSIACALVVFVFGLCTEVPRDLSNACQFLCLCTEVLDLSNAWHPFFVLWFWAPLFAAFSLFATGHAAAALKLMLLATLVAFGTVEVLVHVRVWNAGFGASSEESGSSCYVAALEQREEVGPVPASEPALEDHGDQAKLDPWANMPRSGTNYRQLWSANLDHSDPVPPRFAAKPSDAAVQPGDGRILVKVVRKGGTKFLFLTEPELVRRLAAPPRPPVDAACQTDDDFGCQGKHSSVSQAPSQPATLGQAPSQPEPIRKPLLPAGESEHEDFALEAEAPQTTIPVVEDVSAASLGDTAGPPDRGEPVLEGGDEDTSVSELSVDTTGPSATEDVVLEDGIVEDGASVPDSPVDTAAPQAIEDDAVGGSSPSLGSAAEDDTRPAVVDIVCSDLPLEGSIEVPEQFRVYRDCEDAADTSDTDSQTDDGLVVSTNGFLEYEVSSNPDPAFALLMDSLADAFKNALFVDDSGRPEAHDNDQTQAATTETTMG